ncbi:MAG: hypothetical protein QNJ40_13630 [Xanthomonadales bacterium]|nr:hypothetical protein [Xanthomonadales bacterium]
MNQLSLILPLLAVLQTGPDLRLEERPWVDLSGESCRRQVLLDVANQGTSDAWAISVRAGKPEAAPTFQRRLSAPLAAGGSVLLLLCRPETAQTPFCVDVGVLRLGDQDPSDPNPHNNRWCWNSNARDTSGPGAPVKPKGKMQ